MNLPHLHQSSSTIYVNNFILLIKRVLYPKSLSNEKRTASIVSSLPSLRSTTPPYWLTAPNWFAFGIDPCGWTLNACREAREPSPLPTGSCTAIPSPPTPPAEGDYRSRAGITGISLSCPHLLFSTLSLIYNIILNYDVTKVSQYVEDINRPDWQNGELKRGEPLSGLPP